MRDFWGRLQGLVRVVGGVLAAGAASLACGPAGDARPPSAPREATTTCVSVLGWNDLHGHLAPTEPTVDTGKLPVGGVVALADQVALVRAQGDAVLTLDAGDLFTGPLETNVVEGASIIDAYRVLGVDAAALGNHELDFGPVGDDRAFAAPSLGDDAGDEGPRGALLRRMRDASFPFVSANLRVTGGARPPWPRLEPWVMVRRQGFSVGVVGYSTRETPTTTLPPNARGLTFDVEAGAHVGRAITEARAAGADLVVLLAHASLEGELPQRLDDAGERRGELAELMASLRGREPDLVIAGHRHAWMLGRLGGVPIVSSSQHGVGLARARFCPRADARPGERRRLSLEGVERRIAVAHDPPLTPLGREVARVVAPYRDRVSALRQRPVATLPAACAAQSPTGTALQEQVAAAARDVAKRRFASLIGGAPVVAVINAGALRAPVPSGAVRFEHAFTTFPFDNRVSLCMTTRAGLERALDNLAKKPRAAERYPFGVAGARLEVKRVGTELDVTAVRVEGERSTRDDEPVALAVADFLLWGGDGFLDGVKCTASELSNERIRDAWVTELERAKACHGPARNVTFVE